MSSKTEHPKYEQYKASARIKGKLERAAFVPRVAPDPDPAQWKVIGDRYYPRQQMTPLTEVKPGLPRDEPSKNPYLIKLRERAERGWTG